MQRANGVKDPADGKRLKAKKTGRQRKRWLDSITNSIGMNLSKLWKTEEDRGTHTEVHGVSRKSDTT